METHQFNNMSLVTALGYEYKNSEKARASNIRKNKAQLPLDKIGSLVEWILSERYTTTKKKNHYKTEILKGKLPSDLISAIPAHYKSDAYNESLVVEARHHAIIQSAALPKYIEACQYNQERAKEFKSKIDNLKGIMNIYEPSESEVIEEGKKHLNIISTLYDRLGDKVPAYSLIELKLFYSKEDRLTIDIGFNPDKVAQECIDGFLEIPQSLKDISLYDKSNFSEAELYAAYKKGILAHEDDHIFISKREIRGPDSILTPEENIVDSFIKRVEVNCLDFTSRNFRNWSYPDVKAAIRLAFTMQSLSITKPQFEPTVSAINMLNTLSSSLSQVSPEESIDVIDDIFTNYAEIYKHSKEGLGIDESKLLLTVYDYLKGKPSKKAEFNPTMLNSVNNTPVKKEQIKQTSEYQDVIDFFPFKLSDKELKALTLPTGEWEQCKPALRSLSEKINEHLYFNGIDSHLQDIYADIDIEKQVAKGRINQYLPILDIGIRTHSQSLLSYIEERWNKELEPITDIVSSFDGADD
jgi:hypothetical protein